MVFGTWNVRTMLIPGKLDIVMEELDKYDLDVIAIQETRWPLNGKLNAKNYTLYYSGCDNGNHYGGVGIAIKKKWLGTVMTYNPINERMCHIRLKGKFQNISVISYYAPTEDAEDTTKDEFYDTFEQVLTNIPSYDIKIVMGDANAKVGNEDIWKICTGGNSLHEQSNDNGIRLISFATSRNMKIMSTRFPRKDIHKVTWTSPNGQTKNQIDHILIEGRHMSCIMDVRSKRGAECGTDHMLVIVKIRQRLSKEKREKLEIRPGIETRNLKNLGCRIKFELDLKNRFEALANDEEDKEHRNVNEQWNKIKNTVQAVLEETVGLRKRNKKPWINEECKNAVEERRKSKRRWLTSNTQENKENYQMWNREVNKKLRTCKRNFLKEQLRKAEEDRTLNNARDFYRTVRYFRRDFTYANSFGIKNSQGEVSCNEAECLNLWKDYFEKLLNSETNDDMGNGNYQNVQPYVREPTLQEVIEAIASLKNGKAPGEDGIPGEALKGGGETLWRELHQLILRIWREEVIPEEWKVAIVVPIHKKGDRQDCNNYRGISLINTTYKILSKIISNRLTEYGEEILGEHQAGFRRGRSTTDQFFVIKQILAKYWEYNKSAHILFVDFRKAYDSINRKHLWNRLREEGVPEKLIRMAEVCIGESMSKVKIKNEYSEAFEVRTGVRQGDGLSPLLFNLVLEGALRKTRSINEGLNLGGTRFNILAFADDVALLAEDRNSLKRLAEELIAQTEPLGLRVNEDKTKYLKVSRNPGERDHLVVGSYQFHSCDEFKYLGVTIDQCTNEETEIETRLLSGGRCFWALQKILSSKILSRKTKEIVYKTIIRPVVLYGAETWTLSKKIEKRLITFENKILRKIYGPVKEGDQWRIRKNRELRELFTDTDIVAEVRSRRLRWAGHVGRREEGSMLRTVLYGRPAGKRPRGRPRLRWTDQMERDMRMVGADGDSMQDRARWRQVVGEAKNLLRFEWPN